MANKKLKQEELNVDKKTLKEQTKNLKKEQKKQAKEIKKASKKPLSKADIAKRVMAGILVALMLFSTLGTVIYYIVMGALN